jgi:S1-C subfamily serine protease
MDIFTQLVFTIGRITPNGVSMLGTGFLARADGVIITTHHVTGGNDANLVILAPHIGSLNGYQDLSDNRCVPAPATIVEIDPIRDICVLRAGITFTGKPPELGSFDNQNVGDELWIFGFPHCSQGRRALTHQRAELGAKVLLSSADVKSKHGVINVQARPGQSGSPVFSPRQRTICGVLVGAWVPGSAGIIIAGVNVHELNQTTQCVSAEYVRGML